jgi:hypothetical protein
MRRRFAILIVAAAVLTALASVPASAANLHPQDNTLRVNDVQVLGTHNSYHLRPNRTMAPADASNYAHPPIDQQLASGIRSIEIDVQNAPDFPVYHSIIVDQLSNCPTFAACLATIAHWSRAHPGHVPLTVRVELKEIPTDPNPIIQQAIDNFVRQNHLVPWDAASLDKLDAIVREAFGRRLITPDEVRGNHATLRSAITSAGWPTLAKTRGRVMVILNSDKHRDLYASGTPSLHGRSMFVFSSTGTQPWAAFVSVAEPDAAYTGKLLGQHMIVQTLADADGVEARANNLTRANAAISSGAQIVVTDYPVADPTVGAYVVHLPNNAFVRCDPVTAPKACRDRAVENTVGLTRP